MVAASLAKRAISELFTQQVRAPTMSGSAGEAKRRSIYFFRDICRVSAFLFYSSSALLSARPEQIEGLFPFCLAYVLHPTMTTLTHFYFNLLPAFTDAVTLLHPPTITS
jgi:hypothetical protein